MGGKCCKRTGFWGRGTAISGTWRGWIQAVFEGFKFGFKAPSLGFGRLPMQESNPEKQLFRRVGQLVR